MARVDRELPPIEEDDLVALTNAGAYGAVMSSSHSIAFEVSQSASSSGPGVPFRIFGNIIFNADESVTLTVS